ncbi:probable purine permease 4 [Andrographis paniculata]|uniref:probable purine permease 4 n=1 Tax=Andrographis paniculata TaxID=175694 RepID=UPI0021E8B845|nr:probable purine permease 4 [Andrographis paniculata]
MAAPAPSSELSPSPSPSPPPASPPQGSSKYRWAALVGLNYGCLFVGSVSASLITKYYFAHGGSSRWVSTWVQSAGFPVLLPVVFLVAPRLSARRPFSGGFTGALLLLSLAVGVFTGVNNLLISWGISYLPVSTASLVLSTQLAFNLVLSALMVRQRVSFNNLNCVVLITLSSVLLALISSHERPPGVTPAKYLLGFFATLGAGLMFALYLPLMEIIYRRVRCYAMVVEMQLLMQIAATVFATVGMAADGGFRDMAAESKAVFDRGPAAYWWTIAGCLVAWQVCFLGTSGMVYLTSSLTGGICTTALLAMNVIGGVAVFGDGFGGVKAVATVMCLWGFCSYLYGMYARSKNREGYTCHFKDAPGNDNNDTNHNNNNNNNNNNNV